MSNIYIDIVANEESGQLASIGMVADSGLSFYAEVVDIDEHDLPALEDSEHTLRNNGDTAYSSEKMTTVYGSQIHVINHLASFIISIGKDILLIAYDNSQILVDIEQYCKLSTLALQPYVRNKLPDCVDLDLNSYSIHVDKSFLHTYKYGTLYRAYVVRELYKEDPSIFPK